MNGRESRQRNGNPSPGASRAQAQPRRRPAGGARATTDVAKLVEVPLFALLDNEDRRTLAEMFNTVHIDRGDPIFSHGDPGDSLYIIRRGRVEIFIEDDRGQRIILAENGPADLFGEISLLDGGPRTASAVAAENTDLLMLDREDLLEFITKRPHAALSLLTVMGQRLRATNELLRTHATRNVNLEEDEQRTAGQRASDQLTAFVGSWPFVVAMILGLVAVLLFSPSIRQETFDFPTPQTLNLALTFLVALLSACMLMSQNRRTAKDRLKADLDYQFNLKAELEIGRLVKTVGEISEQLRAKFPQAGPEPQSPPDRNANVSGGGGRRS